MKLRWSLRAKADLDEIRRYIASDNADAARKHLARIRDSARRAAEFPQAGSRLPELDRDDVRQVFVGNYRIVYQIGGDVQIVTVFEGHRLFRP